MNFLKATSCLLAALIATMASFYLMYWLISADIRPAPSQQVVRLSASPAFPEKSFERLEVRNRRERLLPTQPPAEPGSRGWFQKQDVAVGDLVVVESLAETMDFEAPEVNYVPRFRDLVATKVVRPIYPVYAREKQIEGHVVIEFSVEQDGSVRNPYVVESEPASIFDKAALQAIQKFRFKPAEIEGAVLVVDAIVQFGFQLE